VDSSGAIKTSVNMMPPEADCILGGSSIATGSVAATGTHNWSTQYLPQFGNRTLGSNLMAAMTDNGSYPFETRPGGGLNGAWNNTTGYGLAYLAVTLTIGKLYRIRFDASSVSGVASYIGPATNSSATNWRAKSLITAGTNITSTFKATANDLMIVMHTGNGAAAFTLANFTLYEIEEPSLQAEVAKTFHWREFGNGNANGGATGTYKDASMLDDTDRDIAYVMDDGLTSLSGISLLRAGNHSILPKNSGTAEWYVTFIGTGVTINTKNYGEGTYHIAQNLPYGTHVLKGVRDNANGSGLPDYTIDGIAINDVAGTTYASISDISFHQPKMPPIPEDAVVLADYMLMADFVKRTPAINDPNKISKGVRLVSASRDIYYDSAGTLAAANIKPISEPWVPNTYTGFAAMFNAATNQNSHAQLPYFGTTEGDFVTRGVGDSAKVTVSLTNSSGSLETSNVTLTSNITISSQPTIPEGGNNSANHHTFVKSDGVLGSNTVKFLADGVNSGTNYDWFYFAGMTVATPIHTSSHYQTFETPYLHELVGGDRNMEQNNLIVTPDGKSWDEVTRDVSYIGKTCVNSYQTRNVASSDTSFWLLDEWRGATSTGENQFNKDWVMAYDRVICLVDGEYTVNYGNHNQVSVHVDLWKNGVITKRMHHQDAGYGAVYQTWNNTFKRGDYIQVKGGYATINTQNLYNLFQISRR
jgi:hypothetical protein